MTPTAALHSPSPSASRASGIGPLLRTWRQRRRMSQMALALDAEVSARHLSFVESGRAQPSRETVLHLAERLDVTLSELAIEAFFPANPETVDAMRALADALPV